MTSVSDEIKRQLPYLRRYARAMTGDQRNGDDLVRRALERLLPRASTLEPGTVRLALFKALAGLVGERLNGPGAAATAAEKAPVEDATILARRLGELAPVKRQLLMLTTLERLPLHEAADVLGLSVQEAGDVLDEAKRDLRAQPPTRILIIEDEPVIALDIASIVRRNGHTVVGIASTRTEAVALALQERPGLVLADIRLADDSSGIDAVQDILRDHVVPVIFITAYPERLLTGERPEPAFLITKPFDADILDVSISQALATAPAT